MIVLMPSFIRTASLVVLIKSSIVIRKESKLALISLKSIFVSWSLKSISPSTRALIDLSSNISSSIFFSKLPARDLFTALMFSIDLAEIKSDIASASIRLTFPFR